MSSPNQIPLSANSINLKALPPGASPESPYGSEHHPDPMSKTTGEAQIDYSPVFNMPKGPTASEARTTNKAASAAEKFKQPMAEAAATFILTKLMGIDRPPVEAGAPPTRERNAVLKVAGMAVGAVLLPAAVIFRGMRPFHNWERHTQVSFRRARGRNATEEAELKRQRNS